MSFIKELRDRAMECRDEKLRRALRESADLIQVLIRQMADTSSRESLTQLNAAWARAAYHLSQVPPDDSGGGKGIPVPQMERRAA